MIDKKLKLPLTSKADAAHALVKAGLSAIPIAGGPAAELFQYVIQPPLEKRRHEWMAQVGEKLAILEATGLNIEALQANEKFISAVMYASQLALKTHQIEKLEALRNIVVNVALGITTDEAKQQIFLDYIDVFSSMHIRILKELQIPFVPPNYVEDYDVMHNADNIIKVKFPELHDQRVFLFQCCKDLFQRGLLRREGLPAEVGQKQTSEFGDEFLDFISEPSRVGIL